MSRWRPPTPPSSHYITPEGAKHLGDELKGLWERRKDVTMHLAAAAAEGDRSENAEYIYRKKELREIDRRVRYLQKRIPHLQVVTQQPGNKNQVFFGATVTVENDDEEEAIYRIVGADEIDPSKGWISIDAPMARALLKKRIDDEVTVLTPSGPATWYILSIVYE